MKKLPIGIQSFEKLIKDNYLYIDKTLLAKHLIDTGAHYFLSRPRRFGKSLFLDTLENIFLGNKELFKDLAIYNSNYDWKPYPVLHFKLGKLLNNNSENFRKALSYELKKMGNNFGILLNNCPFIETQLDTLIEELSKNNRVVVLVDEYDKPILDNLDNEEVANENRKVLRSFFGTLKDLDKYLKFTFITGVSRFSKASLFSGFNNLKDISLDTRYSELMGYTQEEIENYFQEHIKEMAKQISSENHVPYSSEDLLKELKKWYNGYLFSSIGKRVYNPFSTLCALDARRFSSYWYCTGTPAFLIQQISKMPQSIPSLRGARIHEYFLSDISDIKKVDIASLMYQTGYLTLQSYDKETQSYTLDFPNQEVRLAFFHSLLEHFSNASVEAFIDSKSIRKAIADKDIAMLVQLFNKHFSTIPYDLYKNCKEGFFHAIIISILEFCNLPTRKEEHSNLGRIDLVIERPEVIYICEFKLDLSAEKALSQIKEKKYLSPYMHKGKELVAIGLNFSSETRCISDCKAELYSQEAHLVKELL